MKKTLLTIFSFCLLFSLQSQTTVNLTANKDNTLYESNTGGISNGAGDKLFAGKTQNSGDLRRALVHFDLSSIPTNAIVSSASLSFQVTKTRSGGSLNLHVLTSDWGEGSSVAGGQGGGGASATSGDATWVHTFFNTSNWTTVGGDFSSSSSASATASSTGPISFTSPQLVTDIQNWIDGTSSNFGWIVLGNEGQNGSSIRLASKEHVTNTFRPTLSITYTVSTSITESEKRPKVTIHPNPSTNKINFELENSKYKNELSVIGINGKIIQQFKVDNSNQLDVSSFPNGIYFLQFTRINGSRELIKFIKH